MVKVGWPLPGRDLALAVSPKDLKGGSASAAIVLLLVTFVSAQDFYLADYASAAALRNWWVDASFHIHYIDSLSAIIQGDTPLTGLEKGVASRFYHFLSYVPAALGCVLFGFTPIKSFALIYAPLALFLFAFGIWLLAAECWSRERALWATVLFILLPDIMPYLSSSHDFLRIKWLVSVSPGLGYGVFVSALAWVFCLRGIRERHPGWVVLGWLVCALTVLVKAHLFVANALPLVTYTIIFYPDLNRRWRGLLLVAFLVTYAIATKVAESNLDIPPVWINFSGASKYATVLLEFQPPDVISSWFLHSSVLLPGFASSLALAMALLFAHFGALLLLTVFLLARDIKKGAAAQWLPALAVFSVYILHATGLPKDERLYTYTGDPFELIHRPFVWGVALIMVWTMASLATNYPRALSVGRRWAFCILLLPLSVYFYHDMQFVPRWLAPRIDYSDAYFEALHFLETNTARDELIQVADLDPYFVAQAATGRKPYVVKYGFRLRQPGDVVKRSNEVLQWLQETDTERIISFATENHIDWLLVRESQSLGWSQSFITQHRRFENNGVVVIQFSQ